MNNAAKIEDNKRIQRILDELSPRFSDRKNGPLQINMDEKSKQMFMEYANDLTVSVVEAANMLAQHRGSKTIDMEDINLVLGKKLGIELPQYLQYRQQQNAKEGGGSDNTPSTNGN